MTAHQQIIVQTYQCPDCKGDLVFEHQSWQCVGCGHVPRHSAD